MGRILSKGLILVLFSGCQSRDATPGEGALEIAEQRAETLQRELDRSNALLLQCQAEKETLVRQLEVELAQISELTDALDAHRAKLARSLNGSSTLVPELIYLRNRVEELEKQRADPKEK